MCLNAVAVVVVPTPSSSDRDFDGAFLEALKYYDRLAKEICMRANQPQYIDDARQSARLVLWECWQKYNPSINDNFSKSAFLSVRGAIIDLLRGIGLKSRASNTWRTVISLSKPVNEDKDLEFIERIVFPTPWNAKDLLPEDWEAVLKDDELSVIRMLFWHGFTIQEVADILGLTNDRVHYLRRNALVKLRSIICPE